MTMNNDDPSSPPPQGTQQHNTPERTPRGRGLTALALLAALVGVGLHFHPHILGQAEKFTGPQPWINNIEEFLTYRRPQPLSVAAPEQSGAATNAATGQSGELDTILASLAALRGKIEHLEAEPPAAKLMAELARVRQDLDSLSQRQAASEKAAMQQLQRIETVLGQHDQRLAVATAPQVGALLVARLALVSVNRAMTATDVEQLTGVAALDPALSEAVATLKVLAGQDIPSLAALRSQFEAARTPALSEARSTQLPWWQVGISSARSTMSDWGIARPLQESKDELIVTQAQRRLDLGDIRGALFELDSASPELKNALTLWLDQAHLRLSLDDALFQLVDSMISGAGGQQPSLQGNG